MIKSTLEKISQEAQIKWSRGDTQSIAGSGAGAVARAVAGADEGEGMDEVDRRSTNDVVTVMGNSQVGGGPHGRDNLGLGLGRVRGQDSGYR